MANVLEVKAGLAAATAEGGQAPFGHAREKLGSLGTAAAVAELNKAKDMLNGLLRNIVEVPWPEVSAKNQSAAERIRGIAEGGAEASGLHGAASNYDAAAEKGTEVGTHLGAYRTEVEGALGVLSQAIENLQNGATAALARANDAVNESEAANAAGAELANTYAATL